MLLAMSECAVAQADQSAYFSVFFFNFKGAALTPQWGEINQEVAFSVFSQGRRFMFNVSVNDVFIICSLYTRFFIFIISVGWLLLVYFLPFFFILYFNFGNKK